MSTPTWRYNEFAHCGVDYDDPQLVAAYDTQHARFRGDMAKAADVLLDELGVTEGHTLLDLGCGTGFLAVQAAQRCARVYAVDVSPAMLHVARQKAEAAGVDNIVFTRGGFLTYEHAGAPVDVITSTAALHHLPDFWKQIALRRIAGLVKEDGLFYLMDTVYSFPPDSYADFFEQTVTWFAEKAGTEFREETAMAIREEFSTCDWIMEGLLTRAGFSIERVEYSQGMLAQYWCRRTIP